MAITPNGGLIVPPGQRIENIDNEHYPLSAAEGWHYADLSGSLFPHSIIRRNYYVAIDDVIQGALGNCFFVSALLCILEQPQGAQYIHDMMRDEGTGYVLIRFFLEDRPIYFRLRKSKMIHPRQRHKANWIYILEKGLAIYRIKHGGECYVETKEDDRSTKDTHYKRITFPPRQPVNLIEALTGGHSHEVFACLFKSILEHFPTKKEHIESDLVLEKNIYAHSFKEIMGIPERSFDVMSVQEITALETVFGPYDNPASRTLIDDFLLKKPEYAINNLDTCGFLQQVLRFEHVQLFLRHHFPGGTIHEDTFAHLLRYTTEHLPHKRGMGTYINSQENLFNTIAMKLTQQELVCISTGLYMGRINRERNPLSTGETVVKGLAGPHVYQVLDCYQREPYKFILVRNPWRYYGRTYVYKDKLKILEFRNREDPSSGPKVLERYENTVLSAVINEPLTYMQKTFYHYKPVPVSVPTPPLTRLEALKQAQRTQWFRDPGVFELELSDATKRFENLYSVKPNWEIR